MAAAALDLETVHFWWQAQHFRRVSGVVCFLRIAGLRPVVSTCTWQAQYIVRVYFFVAGAAFSEVPRAKSRGIQTALTKANALITFLRFRIARYTHMYIH